MYSTRVAGEGGVERRPAAVRLELRVAAEELGAAGSARVDALGLGVGVLTPEGRLGARLAQHLELGRRQGLAPLLLTALDGIRLAGGRLVTHVRTNAGSARLCAPTGCSTRRRLAALGTCDGAGPGFATMGPVQWRKVVSRPVLVAAAVGGGPAVGAATGSVAAAAYFARRVLTPDELQPDNVLILDHDADSVTFTATLDTTGPGPLRRLARRGSRARAGRTGADRRTP